MFTRKYANQTDHTLLALDKLLGQLRVSERLKHTRCDEEDGRA
jgi:hypothetical protein